MSMFSPFRLLGDIAGNIFGSVFDPVRGFWRLAVDANVQIVPPAPPAGTTPVVLAQSEANLSIGGTPDTVIYPLTDATKKFTLQSLTYGAEGDPSERGSKTEVFFFDGTNEKIIERVFFSSDSGSIYPNTSVTRDGTVMAGGVGREIRMRRIRLSNSVQQVDSVVRGFIDDL